jgi:hypothetical protein
MGATRRNNFGQQPTAYFPINCPLNNLTKIASQNANWPNLIPNNDQSRTQSNACARARMALALGKLIFSCAVIGLMCMPTEPEPLNLGVPVVNFPIANAILARAQALLWVRD